MQKELDQPEPNRLIKCHGFDYQNFIIVGKIMPYRKSLWSKRNDYRRISVSEKTLNYGRFFVRALTGKFYENKDVWKLITKWEYIDSME